MPPPGGVTASKTKYSPFVSRQASLTVISWPSTRSFRSVRLLSVLGGAAFRFLAPVGISFNMTHYRFTGKVRTPRADSVLVLAKARRTALVQGKVTGTSTEQE